MRKVSTFVFLGILAFYIPYALNPYFKGEISTRKYDSTITFSMLGSKAIIPDRTMHYENIQLSNYNQIVSVDHEDDLYEERYDVVNIALELNDKEVDQLGKINPEAWEFSKPTPFRPVPNAISSGNKLDLLLDKNGKILGKIEAYAYKNGTYLPAKTVFDYLGYHSTLEPENHRLYGWKTEQSNPFVLDDDKNEILFNHTRHIYNEHQSLMANDILYVDIDLLDRIMEISLQVDYAAKSLSYTYFDSTIALARKPKKNIIQKNHMSDVDIEGTYKVPPLTPLPSVTPLDPAKSITPNEDQFLVFELGVNKLTYDDLIEVYEYGNNYYIPLLSISEALEFPIKFNKESGKAEGWYLKETNDFYIDINELSAISAGKKYALHKSDIFLWEDELYLLSTTIDKMLPLSLNVDFSRQRLNMATAEQLPFELKAERDEFRKKWLTPKHQDTYELAYTDTSDIQFPFVDVTLGSSYDFENETSNISNDYSARMVSTLGLFNSSVFVSADDKQINQVRMKAAAYDINNSLFGVTDWSKFEFGDVESFNIDQAGNRALGRGISLSNFPLQRAATFDTTTLTGDTTPGWEVELYRNTTLLDFQIAGDDGRYEFKDVPITYGNNIIRLVFYGPHGEVQEKVERYAIDNSIIPKGTLHYRASLNQRNQNVIEIGENSESSFLNGAAEIEYGVSDSLTASFGTVISELEENDSYWQQNIGVSTTFFDSIIARINGTYDVTNGGWAAQFRANTRFKQTNIRFEHQQFDKFIDGNALDEKQPTQSLSSLGINGILHNPLFSNVSYALNAEYERFNSGSALSTLTNNLTKSAFGLTFSNRLEAIYRDNSNNGIQLLGTSTISGRYNKTRIRFDSSYSLDKNENSIQDVRLSLRKKIFDDFNTNMEINKSLIGVKKTQVSGSLNWKNDNYRINTTMAVDDSNTVAIGLNLAFSLYENPSNGEWSMRSDSGANSGAISARAFMDNNHNNVYDKNEEVLKNVIVSYAGRQYKTNKDGIASFSGLPPDRYNDIIIDESSLDDSFWHAKKRGFTVLSKAGTTTLLEFPIVETSEIEGTVYHEDSTVSGLILHLLTKDGKKIAETKTQYDGFYIFDKVSIGEYIIEVDQKDLDELNLKKTNTMHISVNKGADVFIAEDLALEKAIINHN